MDPEGQLRNLRDFLLVYNRMTEICFQRCTSNFNYRNLTMDEERCADSCAGKLIRTNHRLMGTYVQLMPAMVQKRMQELESKAAEAAKAEAAALETSSAGMTDTQPMPPSNPGIAATASSVEMSSTTIDHALSGVSIPSNMTPQIDSTHSYLPSTNDTSSPNGHTDSLQGPITVPPIISTSDVPSHKAGVGSLSSAVEKLNLNPGSTTAISASESRHTGETQNSQSSS